MSVSEKSAELLELLVAALVDEAEGGDVAIDQMRFAQMELLGHGLGKRLAARVQQALVARQAEQMPSEFRCPSCDRVCPAETVDKKMHTLDGEVELAEVRCHCRRCRRSFFPSA